MSKASHDNGSDQLDKNGQTGNRGMQKLQKAFKSIGKLYTNHIILAPTITLIILLVGVQLLFLIPAPSRFLDAVWEPGEILTLLGSIFLGIVAVYQSYESNALSKRMLDLEEDKYKLELRPFVIVTDSVLRYCNPKNIFDFPEDFEYCVSILSHEAPDKRLALSIEVQNTTESFLMIGHHKIIPEAENGKDISFTNCLEAVSPYKPPSRYMGIRAGETKKVTYLFGNQWVNDLVGNRYEFVFTLINRLGERYEESCEVVFLKLQCENRPNCYIEAQNYEVVECQANEGKIGLQ